MKAFRYELWVSSGKNRVNCSGPMPSGRSSAISEAENMPAEAAETTFVIALVETGALLEQSLDRVEGQQNRQQQCNRSGGDRRGQHDAASAASATGLVRNIRISMKPRSARTGPRPHAKRPAATQAAMIPSAIALRTDFPKRSETTLCSTNKAGKIRNAHRTFGSLKVPRARP